jgi:hypothetical protein
MLFWARFLGPDLAPKKELESRSSSAAATLGVAAATGNADDNFFLPSRISRANDLSRRKFRAKEFLAGERGSLRGLPSR